jgi:hypothetical protein
MVIAPLSFVHIEGIMALMIPIIALMIPIVAVLAGHKQKMAAILNGPGNREELQALRNEVEQLKSLVHQQAFALERLNRLIISAPTETEPLKVG